MSRLTDGLRRVRWHQFATTSPENVSGGRRARR